MKQRMLRTSKPPDSGGFCVGWVVWRCGAWKVASSNERMLAGGGCIVGRLNSGEAVRPRRYPEDVTPQVRRGTLPRRTVPEDGGNSDEPAAHRRREHKSKPPVHTGGFDSTRRTIEANVQLAGRQIQLQKGGENKL